jgi:hypothetical protein
MYRQLYGGSPYDLHAAPAYRAYSPSFRAEYFSGAYLQLFSQAGSPAGLELHTLLRDANVPTDLVIFPQENHVFWNPRRRASSMRWAIDWLDFWLLGRRSGEVADAATYLRWDAMRVKWAPRLRAGLTERPAPPAQCHEVNASGS